MVGSSISSGLHCLGRTSAFASRPAACSAASLTCCTNQGPYGRAKIIDTSIVIIEKWVRWKCLYGYPFYNKDGYHPPFAPGVEETKEVLGEYTKAILLNGSKGKEVTNVAVRLEGKTYQMGFYKAFVLTALPSGSGGESNSGRNNGFEIDTGEEIYGRWNYFAMVLIE